MSSLILFRFHEEFALCAERVKLLRALNPDLPVHGIYGGPPRDEAAAIQALGSLLDGFYTIPSSSSQWKLLHEDLTHAQWFRDVGHRVDFDVVYEIQYDLVLTEPVSRLYPAIDQSSVAVSGVQELDAVQSTWFWTRFPTLRRSVNRYLEYMRTRFGIRQRYVSQGPFPVLSRRFDEALSGIELPDDIFEIIVAELSLPALVEALGFTVVDTGIHPPWRPGGPVCPLFHCEKMPSIRFHQIAAELANPTGRRAFHPVKFFIDCQRLLDAREIARQRRRESPVPCSADRCAPNG
jgi:hypothetical protein